jgi:hypothetical protein
MAFLGHHAALDSGHMIYLQHTTDD